MNFPKDLRLDIDVADLVDGYLASTSVDIGGLTPRVRLLRPRPATTLLSRLVEDDGSPE